MSHTLSEIRLEVREYLGEDDTESDPMWDNTYINRWINRFTRLVAEVTECLEGITTITTVDGTAAYDFPTVTGTPDMTLFRPLLMKRGNNAVLRPKEIKDLGSINVTTEGTPANFVVIGTSIYLYPVPGSAETINVWGYCYPDAMEDDDDYCGLPDEATDIVIKMVLAKARQQEEEFGVANQYYSEIPYNLADFIAKQYAPQRQENQTVRDVMGFYG